VATGRLEQGQRKHIGIQVVPASRGGNAGHVGAFTIASLEDADVMLMGAIEDVTTDKRPAIRAGLAVFDRDAWMHCQDRRAWNSS
jgi:hypothetical protein